MQHDNHAYALARLGLLAKAEEVFAVCRALIAKEAGDKGELHVYKATAGLIAWRNGDIESGRASYREAVDHFEKSNDKQRLPIALGRWADEERRAGNRVWRIALRRARLMQPVPARRHFLLQWRDWEVQ